MSLVGTLLFCLYYGVYMAIKNIVAVVCGMDEEYPFQIIQGINDYAREHSINVSYFAAFGGIVDSEDFDNGEYSIYNLPDYSKFDGALLLTNTFSNPDVRNKIIDKVKEADLPSVIFECKDYEEFYDVSINNYSVIAERKSFTNYGGTFMHIFSWLSSGYGSPIITDSCRTGLSYSEFISKILQPTVQ